MVAAVAGVLKHALSTVFGQGSDNLVIKVAQDYYQGDAQYKVLVDGVQVGGTYTASATKNSGEYDTLSLSGNWGTGTHNVQVVYLNDAWNSTTGEDRNLIVGSVTLNGTAMSTGVTTMLSSGTSTFTAIVPKIIQGTTAAECLTGSAGADIITGGRGGDYMVGNGGHDIFVENRGDGYDTISDFSATGTNSDVVRLSGYMISSFDDLKRHLVQSGADTIIQLEYKNTITLKNVAMSSLTAANFDIVNALAIPQGTVTTAGTGADKLVLKLTQDYFAGDNAKFTVSVDGVQVGGVFSAAAARMTGQQDTLTLSGTWTAGNHTVSVNFLNDAFDAVTLEDRNLMIESATINGVDVAGASHLLAGNGAYSFVAKSVSAVAAVAAAGPSVPASHDVFDYARGAGAKVISTFSATGDSSDVLHLSNYGLVNQTAATGGSYTSFDSIKSHLVQSGADTLVQLSSTDVVTLKNVKASDLTAANFGFASKLDGAMQVASNNGWVVFNNTWGSGDFKYGTDYTVGATYDPDHMTTGTTFNWNYPATQRYAWSKVLAYQSVMFGYDTFGNAGGAAGAVDTSKTLGMQVSQLDKMTSTFGYAMGGDTSGYDVSYDLWLTNKANGNYSNVTNEVMIWTHRGGMQTYGDLVGTYTNGSFTAKIYHVGTYTALVADKDVTAGTIDIADVLKKLQALGIVSGSEYVNQIDFGAEAFKGTGSLTINNLSIDVTSHDATGVVSTNHADGGVTTLTKTGTAAADTINALKATATLVGGAGNDTFVFTKGAVGAVTVDDFHKYTTASAEHDMLKFVGYGSGATLVHDTGDNWTIHYAGGDDHIVLHNVTSLATSDYLFM